MTGISNGKTSSETKQHAKEALAIAEKSFGEYQGAFIWC